MHFAPTEQPKHDELGPLVQTIEALSIAASCVMLIVDLSRLASRPEIFNPLTPAAILLALVSADFVSGLVHWTADTWGSEQWPLIGRRFLRPFRVHHINPHDFLRRNFIDTNGDVAMLCLPILLLAFFIPLTSQAGQLASIFLVVFSAWSLPTNQFHQWAHMSNPPRMVSFLQRYGIILTPRQHLAHHTAPHLQNYCIISGWCNASLEKIDFFRRLESFISYLTGLTPRAEAESNLVMKESEEIREALSV